MKNILTSRKFWVEGFIMTFAMLFGAIGVHFFLGPSNLIIGSISGLSIVLFRLTGIPVSVYTFVINGILLVLAYFLIGREFGLKTVYTALILSPWLYLLEKFFPVTASVMQDPWLDLLCFVLILSFAQTILFGINASSGGLDILAKIINKYAHVNIGASVSIGGAIICCTAFAINDYRMVIIGLIGTWINGLMINHFTAGINMKKRVCIISKQSQRLQDYIIGNLQRGVTLYDVTGGYTRQKSVEIETLLNKDEFAKLMEYINNHEIDAFITAMNISEVYGLWNRKKRKHLHPELPAKE